MTNAGKTFTIAGSDENPGLLPRALEEVFSGVTALSSSSGSIGDGAASSSSSAAAGAGSVGAGGVAVLVSYLEIYNENCYDLLASAHLSGPGGAVGGAAGAAGGAGSVASMSAAAAAAHAAARVPLPLKDGR